MCTLTPRLLWLQSLSIQAPPLIITHLTFGKIVKLETQWSYGMEPKWFWIVNISRLCQSVNIQISCSLCIDTSSSEIVLFLIKTRHSKYIHISHIVDLKISVIYVLIFNSRVEISSKLNVSKWIRKYLTTSDIIKLQWRKVYLYFLWTIFSGSCNSLPFVLSTFHRRFLDLLLSSSSWGKRRN